MTDQPSTQERDEQGLDSWADAVMRAASDPEYGPDWWRHAAIKLAEKWHGSQDVEGSKTPFQRVVDDLTGGDGCACHTGTGHNTSCEHCRPSTTQEAEKAFADALGALQYFTDLDNPYLGVDQQRIREGRDALQSLRTQHTEQAENIERLAAENALLLAEKPESVKLAHSLAALWVKQLRLQRTKDVETIAALQDESRFFATQHTKDREEIEQARAEAEVATLLEAQRREEIARLKALLERLLGWDMMDVTADGPYWKRTIREALEGVRQ